MESVARRKKGEYARPVKFNPVASLAQELNRGKEQYFKVSGRSPRDSKQVYAKALILLTSLAALYVAYLTLPMAWWIFIPLSMCIGLAVASIGFCIQHDGNHGSFSKRPWLNRLAGHTLDLIGGSSHIWKRKHNEIHHTYTNIEGHDDDIEVGFLGRLAPEQPHYWFHRAQHIYLWFIYGFLPVKWQLFDDFYNIARGRIGNYKLERPRGRDLAIFIGGKIIFYGLAFGVPLLFHTWWYVLLMYLVASWVMGVVLAVVFQLAHVVEEAAFPVPEQTLTGDSKEMEELRMKDEWCLHQLRTTVNFSRRNRVLSWFLGGLNFQIEHHLWSKVTHWHYPQLSLIVQDICAKRGIPYNEHRTLWSAIASHYRMLKKLGRPTGQLT